MWVDTHCHLDALEFASDIDVVRQRARDAGVNRCVIPCVEVKHIDPVRLLAHRLDDVYALGIHPMYTPQAQVSDIAVLDDALQKHRNDSRLVAVGEIGIDCFVLGLDIEIQEYFFYQQLKLAQKYELPVILHVRKSADLILKGLRRFPVVGGITHAFNGSLQQAQTFVEMGFKLGFGGAITFERALQIRRLATQLPLSAIVLETDAPDIPPHWLYVDIQKRQSGVPQGRNEPSQLPRIAQVIADIKNISLQQLAQSNLQNTRQVLGHHI
ncbi:MAG: TatD family deoxyribonuclease [Limnohabitans sp.]|nr:TatD family deoxyribonuclease [Limnohabitans sp.]